MIRDIVEFALAILTDHPWIWQISAVGFGLVAVTSVIAVVKAGKSTPTVETSATAAKPTLVKKHSKKNKQT